MEIVEQSFAQIEKHKKNNERNLLKARKLLDTLLLKIEKKIKMLGSSFFGNFMFTNHKAWPWLNLIKKSLIYFYCVMSILDFWNFSFLFLLQIYYAFGQM